jgi:hypothetical protein
MLKVYFNSWVPFIKLKKATKLYDLNYKTNDFVLNCIICFRLFLSIDQWRLDHTNFSFLIIDWIPELMIAMSIIPMFSLKPHHLILFIIEMIRFFPNKQVNTSKTQEHQRYQQCNYKTHDGQSLTSQYIRLAFAAVLRVDTAVRISCFYVDYHVDKGQDDSKSLEDSAYFC